VEQGLKETKLKRKQIEEKEEQPDKRLKIWEEPSQQTSISSVSQVPVIDSTVKEPSIIPEIQPSKTSIQTMKGNIDLTEFSSAVELESLGLDKLKSELQFLGLLCGGTLKERAQRLFSIKGKKRSEIDPKLWAKLSKKTK